MQQHVVLEVGLLAEAPVADVTLEWPRAVVYIHVALEITGRREGLGAEAALVGLLLYTHTGVHTCRVMSQKGQGGCVGYGVVQGKQEG